MKFQRKKAKTTRYTNHFIITDIFSYAVVVVLLFTQVIRTALSWDIVEFFTFHRILVVFTFDAAKKIELNEWEWQTKAQRCEWERCTIPFKLPFVLSSWHHFGIWDLSVIGPFFARYTFFSIIIPNFHKLALSLSNFFFIYDCVA